MKESVSKLKLTYPPLQNYLNAADNECHALVMTNLTENHNEILVIIRYN